jgi:NAD(P)-dependent dehydrogenase (short-subunit alcohol dehydrogenase family)
VDERSVVVIGATHGLGNGVARHYAEGGRRVVITGRDADRAATAASEIGPTVSGLALDLADPHGIGAALADVGPVDRLVVAGIDRDQNKVREYDVDLAIRLVTMKMVGYMEVVHVLAERLTEDASVLLFGGLAKERPYPGSTTVTSVNGGVTGMVRTLVSELAPIRVNAIHPGIVADSPYWAPKAEGVEAARARTPTGRSVMMADITDACVFLLENPSMNGVDLPVDGGWSLP